MTNKKDDETIELKKSTIILAVVIVIAIIAGLAMVYYTKSIKQPEEVQTKEIGEIEETELRITAIFAKECNVCIDIRQAVEELKQAPFLNIIQSSVIDAASAEAKMLINKYDIKKLPTIILMGETQNLPLRGFRDIEDGAVLEDVPPPYVNLDTKNLEGLVDITYLTDETCTKCYNVTQHRDIMEYTFGIVFQNQKTIDISSPEGKELLKKYEITKIPTILMSKEAQEYPAIQMLWDKIGKTADDGTLVFTGFDMTQDIIYKDLKTGKLINASKEE